MGTPLNSVAVGGTPGWAAPEQTLNEEVTEKSDVYTLGLLVSLMTKAVIYGEETTFVLATKKPGSHE
eukprot:CAMPEP_0116895694 /NCGR_PEP_ID=MMETSP0467-20121206/5149_1 /TAXON_ID=283647 /ORGANISM="Mesodinium pulex, Strain SPMC105" /LENGTH=66 /DNA_ID=CAMNT_0004566543 /DNA_START=1079 /DNA_END=1279 /DNA_ORIENTATION=+